MTILNDYSDMAFDPCDVARAVLDAHAKSALDKGIDLDLLVGSGCEGMRAGDAVAVRKILHSLVVNAIKFCEEGDVSIRLGGRQDKPLTLEVRDSGIGMAPDQLERVLQSDVLPQADGDTICLASVQRLVADMQGEIKVSSKLGQGTSVKVTLPFAKMPTVERATDVPTVANNTDLQGLRLLVADDHPTNCLVIRMILESCGAVVTIVEDGLMAVRAWAPGAFDVILLDIAMPVMDGVGALQEIRALEAKHGLAPTPIIAVTANAMAHQVVDYIAAGFDTCLPKPINSSDLRFAISSLLSYGQ